MQHIELTKSISLRSEEAMATLKRLFLHTKRDRSYLEERTKQREHLNSQSAQLEKLLKINSIDEDTYSRYKKLLEMNYERKREETRAKHGFTNPKILLDLDMERRQIGC